MGIDAKHRYRFEYLKSEHWSNLRLAKLASVDACCEYCKHRDLSNDVQYCPRSRKKVKEIKCIDERLRFMQ